MEYIVPKKFKHRFHSKCEKERNARPATKKRMKKRKNPTNSVSASVMHAKMPYIWRFLDNKTRRKMINLARKPIKEINIKSFIK